MDFQGFKDQLLVSLAGIGVVILFWMAMSVSDLNKNVAVVIEKVNGHEQRISTLESKKK